MKMSPMVAKKIVMITTQRTGSTWLIDTIRSSTESRGVLGEIFIDREARSENPWETPWGHLVPKPRYHDWKKNKSLFFASKKYLDLVERKYADDLIMFKIMYNQLKPIILILFSFKARNYKVLHHLRKNLLHSYLSKLRIQKGDSPHSKISAKKNNEAVYVDPTDFKTYIWRVRRNAFVVKCLCKLLLIPYMESYYEDLSIRNASSIKSLNTFLGYSIDFNNEGFKKISNRSSKESVLNYDEISDINYKL